MPRTTPPLLPWSAALALVVSSLPAPADAKLGESQDETILRYGKRAKPGLILGSLLRGAPEHVYHYKGWLIRAAFVDGKVARQSFQKMGPNAGKISDHEIEAILEPEGGLVAWQAVRQADATALAMPMLATKRWRRATDGATATLLPPGLQFVVESPAAGEFERRTKAEKEDSEKKAVPKF